MALVDQLRILPDPGLIENARTYQQAIEIAPQILCEAAIQEMRSQFQEAFPDPSKVSVIPVLNAGKIIGDQLCGSFGVAPNYMQMSNYAADGVRLEKPRCILKPDIERIVRGDTVLSVAFVECVVDSQGTIVEAMNIINRMVRERDENLPIPTYYTFALVSKTGNNAVAIPNYHPMIKVHPDIWVYGMGCDADNDPASRKVNKIMGYLSPKYKQIPQKPYYQPLFNLAKY